MRRPLSLLKTERDDSDSDVGAGFSAGRQTRTTTTCRVVGSESGKVAADFDAESCARTAPTSAIGAAMHILRLCACSMRSQWQRRMCQPCRRRRIRLGQRRRRRTLLPPLCTVDGNGPKLSSSAGRASKNRKKISLLRPSAANVLNETSSYAAAWTNMSPPRTAILSETTCSVTYLVKASPDLWPSSNQWLNKSRRETPLRWMT